MNDLTTPTLDLVVSATPVDQVVASQHLINAMFRNLGAGEYVYTGSKYYPRSLEQMASQADGAYVCIGTVNGTRNDKGNISRSHAAVVKVHAIYLDDIYTKHPIPLLMPSCVIETSHHNYQWVYFFTNPISKEEADQLFARMKLLTDPIGDPGAMTIGRIMRLPMGVNEKVDDDGNLIPGKTGFQVRQVVQNYGVTYTPAELAAAWKLPALDPKTLAAVVTRLSGGADVPAAEIEAGPLPEALKMLEINILGIEDGIIHVECPSMEMHSMNGGDRETSVIVKDDGFGFNCFHGHDTEPNFNGVTTGRLRTAVQMVENQGKGEKLIAEAELIKPRDREALRSILGALADLTDIITTGTVKKILIDNKVLGKREFDRALKDVVKASRVITPSTTPQVVDGEAITVVSNFNVETLASQFLEEASASNLIMVNYQGVLYYYQGGGYHPTENIWLKNRVTKFLPKCVVATDNGTTAADATRRLVGDVEAGIMAKLHEERWKETLPFWRYNDGSDAHMIPADQFMVFENGLLDIKSQTIHDSTPALMVTNVLPFCYHLNPPKPERFLQFLEELWPDDSSSRDLLQEIFGYILSGRTDLHAIFVLVGVKRSGKGTIGRLLTYLVGKNNISSTMLAAIGTTFGREGLIDKTLWLLSDARIGKGVDQAAVVETVLSISGEDNLEISRKYIGAWVGRIKARIMILANGMPKLFDTAGALQERLVPLKFTQSFAGREDRGLEQKLEAEASGIIQWALEGLERLGQNGKFTEGRDRADMLDRFESLASPLHNFIGEEIAIDPTGEALKDDVYARWRNFAQENQRDMHLTEEKFTNMLHDAIPSMTATRVRRSSAQIEAMAEKKTVAPSPFLPGQSSGQRLDKHGRARILMGIRLTRDDEKENFIK